MLEVKESWRVRGFFLLVFSMMFVAPAMATAAPTGNANSPEFVLKFASSWNLGDSWNGVQMNTAKEVVERVTNGRVKLDVVGGPEVFSSTETAQAVIDGAIDGALTCGGYYAGIIPEAYAFSGAVSNEELDARPGAWQALQDLHTPRNLHLWLMIDETYQGYSFLTKEVLSSLDDLKGQRLRVPAGVCTSVAEALGVVPVTISANDVYSGLEQGLIDGYVVYPLQANSQGVFDFIKCRLTPGFLRGGTDFLINLNVWNSFPDDLKEQMSEAAKEIRKNLKAKDKERYDYAGNLLKEFGGSVVAMSDEDAAKLAQIAYDEAWKYAIGKAPVTGPELQKIIGR
jgi:TRAP-type C4-dicarboxylate transport system substrate-binding protein